VTRCFTRSIVYLSVFGDWVSLYRIIPDRVGLCDRSDAAHLVALQGLGRMPYHGSRKNTYYSMHGVICGSVINFNIAYILVSIQSGNL